MMDSKKKQLKKDLAIFDKEARFQLKEIDGKRVLPVQIVNDHGDGLFILPEGYGEYCAAPGEGACLAIEIWEGKLRLVIWGDINKEEPTHIINLEGAREDKREEIEELK